MKLLALVFICNFSQADISSSSNPSFRNNREPAAIGDVIIKNKDNFRVEAFGESRAKEHKKPRVKKTKKKDSK